MQLQNAIKRMEKHGFAGGHMSNHIYRYTKEGHDAIEFIDNGGQGTITAIQTGSTFFGTLKGALEASYNPAKAAKVEEAPAAEEAQEETAATIEEAEPVATEAKAAIELIEIEQVEGMAGEMIHESVTAPIVADSILQLIADNAPDDGSYHKTDVVISWTDGEKMTINYDATQGKAPTISQLLNKQIERVKSERMAQVIGQEKAKRWRAEANRFEATHAIA